MLDGSECSGGKIQSNGRARAKDIVYLTRAVTKGLIEKGT